MIFLHAFSCCGLSRLRITMAVGLFLGAFICSQSCFGFDIVVNGQPVAVIVTVDGKLGTGIREIRGTDVGGRPRVTGGAPEAAKVLVDWIEKISEVRLVVTNVAPASGPVIYIGEAAGRAGLKLDDIASPSQEGLRLVVKGNRALIGGQNDESTVRAACRFLERLGCRFYMDDEQESYRGRTPVDLGKVYPRTKNLSIKDFEHSEKPGMLYRSFWGSNYYKPTLWRLWNGDGGIPMSMGHSWAEYVPRADYFETHPEYFALINGRRNGDVEWLCTSNPDVRKLFVRKLLAQAKDNPNGSFSLSPPDNRQYCECADCRAKDDPRHIVVSSGRLSMTERFLDFFNDIAGQVRAQYPDVTLNFYAYADYTEAPLPENRYPLEPNLVVWVAPIRYSRYHHIGNPVSRSAMELKKVVDDWGAVASKLGYRTYNFNLAEVTVPFSKLKTWEYEFPYLKGKGLLGVNNETFVAWGLMGPHLFLSLRIMYDPDIDSQALMDDYFTRFYGADAGPEMKDYWMSLDQAFQNLKSEAGCFYALHLVYTPEFLRRLQDRLDRAAAKGKQDPVYAARIALADKGLKMAWDYMQFRDAINRGEVSRAKSAADAMRTRAESDFFCFHEKTLEYLRRFILPITEKANPITTPPNKLLVVLPDEWAMTYDDGEKGMGLGYNKTDFDDSAWHTVKTYSATLNEQGAPEQAAFMWYRTRFVAPPGKGRLILFFGDIDGNPATSRLFINGIEVKTPAPSPDIEWDYAFEPNRVRRGVHSLRGRQPVLADVTKLVVRGKKNTIALLLDHRETTENNLGGIVRPVYLCEVAE